MTESITETQQSEHELGSGMQHHESEARSRRESSVETWYASAAAKRGGLETGARGWRWVAPAETPRHAEQHH